MKKLREYTLDFKVSRPIFDLQISTNGDTVSVQHVGDPYNAKKDPVSGDFLSELVSESYSESFDIKKGSYYMNRDDITKRAMHIIRNRISCFVEKNLEMRNPRLSKLYRWTYRCMPTNDEFNDILIMLYGYFRSFTDSSMRGYNPEHIKNGIAILEAIMEKYEK